MSLRGTLVNNAEDLSHSDVHLVVGVPHFARTAYQAPVAASDGGDPWTDPEQLVLRELSGWIRWAVALEPSESKTITYEYERYVPSN